MFKRPRVASLISRLGFKVPKYKWFGHYRFKESFTIDKNYLILSNRRSMGFMSDPTKKRYNKSIINSHDETTSSEIFGLFGLFGWLWLGQACISSSIIVSDLNGRVRSRGYIPTPEERFKIWLVGTIAGLTGIGSLVICLSCITTTLRNRR